MVFPADSTFVTRHVPPSRIRYEQKNPKVSVRLTESVREVLDEARESSGASYADLIKRGLTAAADEETAYQRGWDDAKEGVWGVGVCYRCGKSLYWNLAREGDRRMLAKAIQPMGYTHKGC